MRVSTWFDSCWWRNALIESPAGWTYNVVLTPAGEGVRDTIHFLGHLMEDALFVGTFGSLRASDRIGDSFVAAAVLDPHSGAVGPEPKAPRTIIETVGCFAEESSAKISAATAAGVEGFDLELRHFRLEAGQRGIPHAAIVIVADFPQSAPFWTLSRADSDRLHDRLDHLCRTLVNALCEGQKLELWDLLHTLMGRLA